MWNKQVEISCLFQFDQRSVMNDRNTHSFLQALDEVEGDRNSW
jgi:hypothetical protein